MTSLTQKKQTFEWYYKFLLCFCVVKTRSNSPNVGTKPIVDGRPFTPQQKKLIPFNLVRCKTCIPQQKRLMLFNPLRYKHVSMELESLVKWYGLKAPTKDAVLTGCVTDLFEEAFCALC